MQTMQEIPAAQAFRAWWSGLNPRPLTTEREAYIIYLAGMREQSIRLADELESAAKTERQYARALLYKQIAARLRG